MWSWFGGAAAQKRKDAPKNAILLLREQLDMLQKREKHLENQIAEQEAVARKNVNTNKNGTSCSLWKRTTMFGVFLWSEWSNDLSVSYSCQSRTATEKGARKEP